MEIKQILKNFLLFLIKENPIGYKNIISSKKNKFILEFINRHCPQCINNSNATKIYWFINNIKSFPICHYCKQPIKRNVINVRLGYNKNGNNEYIYCCQSHSALDAHTQLVKQNNNYKKYGVKSTNSLESVKSKKKITWLKKYNTDNPAKSTLIKQKMSCTIKEKNANSNYLNEKINKSKKTRLEKYGNSNYNNREKSTQTRLLRNNGKYFSDESLQLISQSRQLGNLNKKYIQSYEISGKKCRITILSRSYDKIVNDILYEPCFSKNFFIENQSLTFNFKWRCKLHNILFYSPWKAGCHKICPLCRKNGISKPQKELYNFLYKNTTNIISINDRSTIYPLELDIYIKDNNFAIEFNGSYWHNNKDINYHINKTKICEQKNIKLLHIWEHEWKNNEQKKNIKELILKQLNNNSFIFNDNIIELDRSKFPIITNIPNYTLIDEIPPIKHIVNNFQYYDCGKIIFKKCN